MKWQIITHPWPVGDKVLINPGEVIDGAMTAAGLELRWRGQLLPTQSLPQNIVPTDDEALRHLQRYGTCEAHRLGQISPLPPPPPGTPKPSIAAVPRPLAPTPPAWQLLTDWAAGSGPGQHVPAGEILQGVCDRYGSLVAIRWRDQTFGTALPMEACALDQKAADELSRQHGERLFMLRAVRPAVIRAV
jgi:hypothetical protein